MEGLALELGVGAVKFMVESFMQQLNEQKHLIKEAPQQVEGLEDDLKFLKEYLKNAVNNTKSDNLITRTLLREVRKSVYKAEDAIDSFVIEVAESESKWFSGAIPKSKFVDIAELIKSVAEKVKEVREKVEQQINNAGRSTENEGLGEYEGPPGKQKYAPIFKKEEKRLREFLAREAQQPEAIFITGTHGIGKTTLAAKMFHDPDMREQFTKRIWVSVSNPTAKNIFQVLLRQLKILPVNDPISESKWELSQQVASLLKEKRFLIVLDNVSEMKHEDWKSLESALEESDKKSKIFITSNNDELARFFVRHDSPIKLEKLNDDDSWSLLQWQVFSKIWCPPDLVNEGLLIARNCHGLPQAIVFAGDTLARKDSQLYEMSQRRKIWQQVSLGMVTYFNDRMGPQSTSILSSYNQLPYHLRACFLYLGIFPEQSKFSVSKLIRMWIAEGFVQQSDDTPLENTAEEYLRFLIDRNLVIIEEKRPDGSAKTCSMNALLYDFCKTESGNERENFLQEFRKSSSDGVFIPPINEAERNRRVCVHSHISKFIPKFISSRNQTLQISLRSFVSHSKEPFTLPSGDISKIRAAFKLLRVLDAKPMKFNKIHSDLCQLVHLRYVTLSLNGDVLPAAISKLRNIQTLIVHTASPTLEIKADILKMDELRHFQTNASATLPKKSKASDEDERLQTLSGISPKSCTQEFFRKTPNLKKLGICGQLALLLDGKNDLLSKLDKVEKLKLLNHVTSPKYEGKLSSLLLQPTRFPKSLRSLTLSATSLEWKHISILGPLQVEELKLKDNAFVGERWEVHDEGFPHLQTLHIERLRFKQWKSSSAQFPQLKRLMLSECKELMELPTKLAEIGTFRELHLRNGNESAAECAHTIRAEKLKMKRIDSRVVFKLSFDDL